MAKAKFLTLEKKSVLTRKSKLGFGSQHSPTPCGSAFHILTGPYWSVPTLLSPPSYLSSFRGTLVLGGLFTRPLHEWEMHENMVLFSGFCLIMIAPICLSTLAYAHSHICSYMFVTGKLGSRKRLVLVGNKPSLWNTCRMCCSAIEYSRQRSDLVLFSFPSFLNAWIDKPECSWGLSTVLNLL